MYDILKITLPGNLGYIVPGCRVKLSRFESIVWVVSHGWYSWGGNRPVCGWFLTDMKCPKTVKPLQLTDLDDIYVIEN